MTENSNLAAAMRQVKSKIDLPRDEPSEGETVAAESVSRDQILAFLSDRRSYAHRPRSVCRIETHASDVFLAGPYVFKVKKPLNLGFLDFSTLERRRHFSEREVTLNQRLCPDAYLGVTPIYLASRKLSFEAGGRIVEYAVKMRKLDDRYFLLGLLKRGKVGWAELDRVISALAEFYKAQRPGIEITQWGRIEKLRISTRENFRQTREAVGLTISRPAFEAVRYYTNTFYTSHEALFSSRVRQRRICDCHGDLHLDHVHLSPTRLSIYDCIEFNDRFRYIDCANDVAFLAMDLDYHGRPDFSKYLTERIAAALGDPGMLRLMDFYKCYRAYVRGKVKSIQASRATHDREAEESRGEARRYFQLALRYAVCGSQPMVLIVMGRVASGKSTLAEALGRELDWDVVSSDRTRKELAGVALHERGDEDGRRQLYSEPMTERTYEVMFRKAIEQTGKHRSVILDATFSRRQLRGQVKRRLRRAHVSYYFVEAGAPKGLVKERLMLRNGKTDEISDARLEDFDVLNRSYDEPEELAASERVTVSTAKAIEAAVLAALKSLVRRPVREASRL